MLGSVGVSWQNLGFSIWLNGSTFPISFGKVNEKTTSLTIKDGVQKVLLPAGSADPCGVSSALTDLSSFHSFDIVLKTYLCLAMPRQMLAQSECVVVNDVVRIKIMLLK